jgi:uncharacterized protein YjiS (DUF1127 family)
MAGGCRKNDPAAAGGGARRKSCGLAGLIARAASRLRRWREDRQTLEALRHLDDRQVKEFGIYPRPRDLTNRKFR